MAGAVNVCDAVLSVVADVLPTASECAPLCPDVATDAAPVVVHPLRVPVSKPPFVIVPDPPPPPPVVAGLIVSVKDAV